MCEIVFVCVFTRSHWYVSTFMSAAIIIMRRVYPKCGPKLARSKKCEFVWFWEKLVQRLVLFSNGSQFIPSIHSRLHFYFYKAKTHAHTANCVNARSWSNFFTEWWNFSIILAHFGERSKNENDFKSFVGYLNKVETTTS